MKEPFEAVVQRHGPTVLRVCRAVLARHDAEDAWSETFLAALRAYPDLPSGANVQAWLVTIAHRKAVDLTRANQRRPFAMADPPEVAQPPPEGDDALWDCLRSLPPKQRQVVAYHHLAGLAYADIAAIVGGTPAAARRAGADGVRALRHALSPLEVRSPA